MVKQACPDKRLVYLHCSSIFSGANAQVRKAKKISQLLQKRKESIKILTKEYTLPAIAAVAKELLEEQIFESLPRAKLNYPELFQTSETQEAERAASEAEVVRIEAEAAQDIVLTSDDEGDDECPEFEGGQQRAEPKGASKSHAEVPGDTQIDAVDPCAQPTSQAHGALSFPRLHPVYLPFKTQHRVLVSVQAMLEECCLEFGNVWVPDLMEARKWHEAESIELTKWTKRILKFKSLPPSAMKPIAGKSNANVFFETDILRHSAVHRLPTSAAGLLSMLGAAINFAEALNDPKRAERVAEIKTQLEASIEEIVQHQNLLERKLTDQLEDIARRRAELDKLEKLSIEEMLATDKQQRTEVGSAFESFLVSSNQALNPCACTCIPKFGKPTGDSEVGENVETSETHPVENEQNLPDEKDAAQALRQEEPYQFPQMMGREISEKFDRKFDATVDTPIEPPAAVEEAIPVEEPGVATSEQAFPVDESYIIAPEEPPWSKDPSEAASTGDPLQTENIASDPMWGASQAEPTVQSLDDMDEPALSQHDDEPYGQTPSEPDIIRMYSDPAEDQDSTMLPPISADEYENVESHPPLPSAPPSILTSALEAAAPDEAPPEDSHTILLKILHGSKVLRSIVFITACTRTAILNEARAYCAKRAQDDQSLGILLANGWRLALVSLKMYGCDMDLSTYQVENLSSLVRTVEKSGMPRFTLRISEA